VTRRSRVARVKTRLCAAAQARTASHQTRQRRVERAVAEGPMVTRSPASGYREPTLTRGQDSASALARRKARELGYPHGLSTTRLLASHAREHGPTEEHACPAKLVQGTVYKALAQEEIKPRKVRYYLERRAPRCQRI
jgi:hypothetical protein